jgi:hypothetical protein
MIHAPSMPGGGAGFNSEQVSNFAFDACGPHVRLGAVYESRKKPLLPRRAFYRRLARSLALGCAIVLASLGLGMLGYHGFENLPWLDAFLNAAMILSGMGPVSPIQTPAGKLFAGCYALFSGLALITTVAVIFAPIFHRFLHKFHLEAESREK